jgi:hypothetical protein
MNKGFDTVACCPPTDEEEDEAEACGDEEEDEAEDAYEIAWHVKTRQLSKSATEKVTNISCQYCIGSCCVSHLCKSNLCDTCCVVCCRVCCVVYINTRHHCHLLSTHHNVTPSLVTLGGRRGGGVHEIGEVT